MKEALEGKVEMVVVVSMVEEEDVLLQTLTGQEDQNSTHCLTGEWGSLSLR